MRLEKYAEYSSITILLFFIFTPVLYTSYKSESEHGMENTIMQEYKFTNHLINESSPYLLQHAHNPVDWYPWSEEALARAKSEDKPIFLSIGYAACHWCHVMERESFENEEFAALLNENFISIKVDREQRPDLDQIYMAATIAMNGSGGWPMSVFLTPDLKPFFAGTYFPPEDSYGRPGFKSVITQIAEVYNNERQNIEAFAQRLSYALDSASLPAQDTTALDKSTMEKTADMLMAGYDSNHGGFGGAPKFPHATDLSFLLKIYSGINNKMMLQAVEHTLQSMARGGLYDQIGGGFHRYSIDEKWLVPHFEKMLYDNAMLVVTYSEAYQVTRNKLYKKIAEETLDFMIREMQDKKGGFYSSLDADSEAEEGKFYTWTKSEIDNLLGKESDIFCSYYNITDSGNFEEGKNIPNINRLSDDFKKGYAAGIDSFEYIIENQKEALFRERSKRIRPFTDDKILTSWNGLAISGLSRGYQITGKAEYRTAARQAAEFIYDNMYDDGSLVHSYRDGKTSSGPFLEDYAYLVRGLIDLYETVYDFRWIEFASKLADEATRQFSDKEGHLYLSPPDQADHFIRPRDEVDGALPAPGSVLIESLLKLADITGNKSMQDWAEKSLAALSGSIVRSPVGMISAIAVLNYLLADRYELILVGEKNRDEFTREIYSHYFPNRVIVISDKANEEIALLKGRQSNGKTTAYICKNSVCMLPAESVDELKSRFDELALRN